MDFLDFQTTIYRDKVMLLDGIYSRFALTWPFVIDPMNDPRCPDEENKHVQRQKKKNKPNKKKLKELGKNDGNPPKIKRRRYIKKEENKKVNKNKKNQKGTQGNSKERERKKINGKNIRRHIGKAGGKPSGKPSGKPNSKPNDESNGSRIPESKNFYPDPDQIIAVGGYI